MSEKVSWKKLKRKIMARHGFSHFPARPRRVRKRLVGGLSLLLVLAMVFGLNVKSPMETAGASFNVTWTTQGDFEKVPARLT